ncbi:MAG: 4Fe-4S dicluster domain-containing protein [Candidatus Lokiarchaeota archaeon]
MSKRYGFIIDQERCIGCDACTIACNIEREGSQWFIKVETQNSNQKDTPTGKFPKLDMIFLPKLCNHCEDPPCLKSCPVEAISKRNDGIVVIDEEKCIGCKDCVEACPYRVMYFDENRSLAEKCNLCAHRIDIGLKPFCAVCCEGQAIYFGDFNNPKSKVSRILSENKLFRLKVELSTNPIIYYSPPKPKNYL